MAAYDDRERDREAIRDEFRREAGAANFWLTLGIAGVLLLGLVMWVGSVTTSGDRPTINEPSTAPVTAPKPEPAPTTPR